MAAGSTDRRVLPATAALQRLLTRLSSGIDHRGRAGTANRDRAARLDRLGLFNRPLYSGALYILASAVFSIAATVPLPDYTNRDISGERAYGSASVRSAVPVEASPGD